MDWIWHDGGRSASGFVGTAGDCVPRAVAIATGEAYRDVYASLHEATGTSPRQGVVTRDLKNYLKQRGWSESDDRTASAAAVPRGVVLLEFESVARKRSGHLSCLINHTLYDTWNPFEDADYRIARFWICDVPTASDSLPLPALGGRPITEATRRTQAEYERILKRVRALHRTASNHASTEGEIRNALRAMQGLMLTHNLSRHEIEKDDGIRDLGMTRRACPLNRKRACQWELSLANYVTTEVFSTVQFYQDRQGHRTLLWFFGPVDDVEQALGLFREMLLTIATAAQVRYGGHARGSGASYAEGYVQGLPRTDSGTSAMPPDGPDRDSMARRSLAVQSAADEWLRIECGIRLHRFRRSGRFGFDPTAHRDGRIDGAQHQPPHRSEPRRLTHRHLPPE